MRANASLRLPFWLAALALSLAAGQAQQAAATELFVVSEPWLRPANAGASTSVYMTLKSNSAATLVGAQSDAGERMVVQPGAHGSSATADRGATLALPADVRVRLAPGGARLVLVSARRALRPGDRVPLVLTIEHADGRRQTIPVDAEVRYRSPTDDEMRAHGHPPAAGAPR